MKKIYSILLTTVLLTSVMSVKAQNVGDHFYDSKYQLCYEVLKTRTISTTLKECYVKVVSLATYQSDNNAPALSEEQIAAYNNLTDLVIPSFYTFKTGLRVECVEVADNAYKNNENLKTITFSINAAGVNSRIGNSAFSGCTNLEKVTFTARDTINIERTAFLQCAKLDSVKFGEVSGETTIGMMAFANCSSLDACGFIYECNLTGIADQAFGGTATGKYNEERKSYPIVVIPESVTHLGSNIFANTPVRELQIDCPLTEDYPSADLSPFYTIREQIEYVDFSTNTGDHAPAYICYGMKNATFDFGQFKTFGAHSFDGCESFSKTMWIPSETTSIGDSAFAGLQCERVNLPEGILTIGKDVFGDMKKTALFIINKGTCDDALLSSYAKSADDFTEIYLDDRLFVKGENRTPKSAKAEVINATEAGKCQTYQSGIIAREPLCGVDNFVFLNMDNAYFVATNQDNDTIQKFPFSHFEYNGNEYLGGDTVQLASDNTQKIKAFYSPIAVKKINATVTFPEAGDSSDGSTAKVRLSGSTVRLRGVTLLNMAEEEISEETLKPGTTYKVRFAVAANTVSYYFRKKAGKPDLEKLTITVNGEAATNVDTENSQVIVFAEFKTEGKDEALNDITTETKARKVFRNGQLVIIRGDKEYNALGAEMK
ncbi:MAG: leucine-rich repeat domain-containing protein [Paludibacteraceae bacterium]|nr:leucine-rich repeat domain-containing protein [Paludibacteraceae bacterium]